MSETEVKKTVKRPVLKKTDASEPKVAEVVAKPKRAAKPKVSPPDETVPEVKKSKKSRAKTEATAEEVAEVAEVPEVPVDHKGSKTTSKNIDAIIRALIKKFGLDEKVVKSTIADYLPLTSEFKKKKAKKDPDAPKKAPSSYMIFTMENRENVIKENKDMKFQDITRELGKRWGKLTPAERQVYNDKAKVASEKHKKEDAAYRKEKGLPERVPKVKKEVKEEVSA